VAWATWIMVWAWIICSNSQWDTEWTKVWIKVWIKACSLNLVALTLNLNSKWTNSETGDSINSRTSVEVSPNHNSHHSLHQALLSTNRSNSQWTKVSERSSLQLLLKTVTPSTTDS
jgi:hypothetical protein